MRFQSPALPTVVIALLLLSRLTPSAAADWPRWRGPSQNGHAPEGAWIPTKLPISLEATWRVRLGDGVGSPVVAGGMVFYLDNQNGSEVLHAVRITDGSEIWQAGLDKAFKDGQTDPGPRGTPLVHDGLVYVQSCQGQFKCLQASDGKPVWETHFQKDFEAPFFGERGKATGTSRHGNTGSPVIVGEDIFVPVGGTNGASIVCFNRRTGKERWRSQSDITGYGPVLHTRLAGHDQLLHFSVDGIMGLAPADGALLWRVPMETGFGRHVATPVLSGDVVVISSHEAGLTGIRVESDGDGFKATTAWVNKEAAINFASPVAVGDFLYGLGPSKNILCVKIPTGEVQWSRTGLIQTDGKKAHAGFLVVGDRILLLTDGGTLALFAADPAEYREFGQAQAGGSNWCNPAYADGQLYFRDARNLYRIDLK